MIRLSPLFLVVSFVVFGCTGSQKQGPQNTPSNENVKVGFTSLSGQPLPEKTLSDSVKKDFERKLIVARANLDRNPDDLDLIIWYGRRLAYLGRHQEAIHEYTKGLKRFPDSYRLRRHRGHRYITTRQLDLAIRDFGEAVKLSQNAPNAVEPDGLPNAANIPLGNDKFNIWYHYGLTQYLLGYYDRALEAYQQCMTFSENDDLKAATSYWLYMSAVKSGANTLAERTLQNISTSWDMIENEAYMDMLLMFKGIMSAEQLIEKATNANGVINPTYAYGIGFYLMKNNRTDQAKEVFNKALQSPSWESFGFIACEAEMSR